MTLTEAATAGIARVRLPMWANPEDYVKLYLMPDLPGGGYGPWAELYSPVQRLFPDMGRPQRFLIVRFGGDQWEPYTGPIAEDER